MRMNTIVLLYDPENMVSEKLSDLISYRPRAKSFIARMDEIILLCNPAKSDLNRYTSDLPRRIVYVFILNSQPLQSVEKIFSIIQKNDILSNMLLLSIEKRKVRLVSDLIDLFYRSMGIGYDIRIHAVKDANEITKIIIQYITKKRFIKYSECPIQVSDIPYFPFYVERAIEIFRFILRENKIIQGILIGFWYKYFGLFQEKFPNWLKLIALLTSFAILDVLAHNQINALISSLLIYMPFELLRRIGSDVIIGIIRWIIYFLVLIPLISEIYFITLKTRYRKQKCA